MSINQPPKTVLYVTPFPPARGGIADYAAVYRSAVEMYTDWRLRVAPSLADHSINSISSARRMKEVVAAWQVQEDLLKCSLVHAELGYRQHAEFYALYWLRRLQPEIPYVITVHDPPLVIVPALNILSFGKSHKFVWRLLRALDYTPVARELIRDVLDHAAAIFVLSRGGQQVLQHGLRAKERAEYLPLISYTSDLRERPRVTSLNGMVRILFLGFWGKAKGIETLIHAMERLLPRCDRVVELVFAGGTEPNGQNKEYVDYVTRMVNASSARGAIKLLGYVPDHELSGILAESDVMTLPYLRAPGYSASSVLIRAMGAGLAIVASRSGTLAEEVRDGDTGLLVEPGDVEALTNALLRLSTDDELRTRLGAAGQRQILADHAQQKVASAVDSIYCNATNKSRLAVKTPRAS